MGNGVAQGGLSPGLHSARRGCFLLEAEQWLAHPLETVFAYFADASNLEHLTPPWLRFSVRTPQPIEMRVGLRIDYQLRLRGLPIRWQSEITAWAPPHRFVDEQRRGPYRIWIHEHTFTAQEGGTLVRDTVHYAVLGGRLVNRFLVRPDLDRIFAFRRAQLEGVFPAGRADRSLASSPNGVTS